MTSHVSDVIWLLSEAKNQRIRDTSRDTSVLRSLRLGGYSVRRWVRVCSGTMKPLPYQRHIPLQFILWENARALKCFASASFDQQELFNFFFLAINRNYLMLLRMRCFVYFRSGRILFAM